MTYINISITACRSTSYNNFNVDKLMNTFYGTVFFYITYSTTEGHT